MPSQKDSEPAAADNGSAVDVVGDIIWNLESAMKSRPPAPPPPEIPVGPDPSLASEALEAAFALLARRDLGLPDDAFVMPRKRPGMTRIALLIPVTGENAALGAELQRGAELALFSVRNPALELLVFDTHEAGAEWRRNAPPPPRRILLSGRCSRTPSWRRAPFWRRPTSRCWRCRTMSRSPIREAGFLAMCRNSRSTCFLLTR